MRLVQCNQFPIGANHVEQLYKNMCNTQLLELLKQNNLGLTQLTKKYSIEDIQNAFEDIFIDGKGYITVPEQSNSSVILRYLEYGGEDVKPTHLISNVNNKIINKFSIKEESNVF